MNHIEMHPDNKKYIFTGECHPAFPDLKRIKRISDDLIGGWIACEDNLSFEDSCFVYDNAMVFNDAKVSDNASMYDNARIAGNARLNDNSRMFGNSSMHDNSAMHGNSSMLGKSEMQDYSSMHDSAKLVDGILTGRQVLTGICRAELVCNLTSVIENYSKTLNNLNGVAYIAAGCRWFSLKKAKEHWENRPDRVMTFAAMKFASEIAKMHGLVEDESELSKTEFDPNSPPY